MDFALTAEQASYRDRAREVAATLESGHADRERAGRIEPALRTAIGAAGLIAPEPDGPGSTSRRWRLTGVRSMSFALDAAAAVVFARTGPSRGRGRDVIVACLLHGQYGYRTDLPIEQRLRDVLGLQIGDGTAQIMKLVVARQKLGRALAP
jgi:Acyl-CoA dehydrogenase, C-terminal domain